MIRRTRNSLCVAVLLLPLASCKFLSGPDYDLTVTVETGVTGSPASGIYTHADLDQVAYSYTPLDAKHTVEVMIDGGQAAAAETLTIYHSTSLVARLVDIRDAWSMTTTDSAGTQTKFTVTFSGDNILGGTFSDSRGYAGTWTGPSNVITITYSNWEQYKLTGALFSMSGTWTNGTATGSWSASRL
jgi:hypothetical protein